LLLNELLYPLAFVVLPVWDMQDQKRMASRRGSLRKTLVFSCGLGDKSMPSLILQSQLPLLRDSARALIG
jgi:hypothetical protein